jgi:hypothetical protein
MISLYGEHAVYAAYIISAVTGKKLPARQDDDVKCLRECIAVTWTGLKWHRMWSSGGLLD